MSNNTDAAPVRRKKKIISISVSDEVHEWLHELARESQVSASAWISMRVAEQRRKSINKKYEKNNAGE